MHLEVTKLKDKYPYFTQMADVCIITTLNMQPEFKWIWLNVYLNLQEFTSKKAQVPGARLMT